MPDAWKHSLHGGHSREFCEHAESPLREMLDAAVAAGYTTFGVSEHAPRIEERFLYPSEREKGYTTARLRWEFEVYAAALPALVDEYAERGLTVLRGFEAEVVPQNGYAELMRSLRENGEHEYMVGSVHYVGDRQIDGSREGLLEAAEAEGSFEDLAVRYYETVAEMALSLRPEVVGHFDLVKKFAGGLGPLDTPRIRRAADEALEAAREAGAILDLNTAGWRVGLSEPYPAPWLVARASEMGLPFCFGDDSHAVGQVGAGLDDARRYLLSLGVSSVTTLARGGPGEPLQRVDAPLA